MIGKVGEYTIVATPTLSGLLECRLWKGRDPQKGIKGEFCRIKGDSRFLAESLEDAKKKVRKEFGIDQTKLEDFK